MRRVREQESDMILCNNKGAYSVGMQWKDGVSTLKVCKIKKNNNNKEEID